MRVGVWGARTPAGGNGGGGCEAGPALPRLPQAEAGRQARIRGDVSEQLRVFLCEVSPTAPHPTPPHPTPPCALTR